MNKKTTLLTILLLFTCITMASASSFTGVSTPTVQVNTTGNVILCTGTGWTTGTTAISITGSNTGAAALTGTLTANSTTTALVALNAGTATGTITLSDGLGHTQTITIVSQLITPITNSATDWTTGLVGTTSTPGNNWTLSAGSAGIPASAPYTLAMTGGPILRPTSENVLNETFVYTMPHYSTPNYALTAYLRYQGTTNYYYIQVNDTTHSIYIYKVVSGTATQLGVTSSYIHTETTNDNILVSNSVITSGSSAILTCSVYDQTSSQSIAYYSYTEATATFTTAGQIGLDSQYASNFNQAYTYNSSPQQFTVSPPSGPNGGSQTLTLTGNPSGPTATAWVNGTTEFSVAGGTGASVGSTTVNNSTQVATLTLTNGSLNSFLILSNNTDASTGYPQVATPATSYTTTGPVGTIVSTASTNFTVTPNGYWTGIFTPASSTITGTFTPSTLTFSSSSITQTFTFTPSTSGTTTITVNNNGALTNTTGGLTFYSVPPNVTLGVTSAGVQFSPANWSGDTGRGGTVYRQSWTPGAWVKFHWTTTYPAPTAALAITNATTLSDISYYMDGILTDNVSVPASGSIPILNLSGAGSHELDVYYRNSQSLSRWALTNSIKVTGLTVDGDSTPVTAPALKPWVLEIGDSITDGYASNNGSANNLYCYSFLTGQILNHKGFDYAVSACASSGWIVAGDPGLDVLPYYAMTGTTGSQTYAGNSASRWCNIDANNSLLDSANQISAYGSTGTTPSVITIEYATNEAGQSSNTTDMENSIVGCLTALRTAAPNAWVLVYVPFELYDIQLEPDGPTYVTALKTAVAAYQAANPSDTKTILVDYGSSMSYTLGVQGIYATVHPGIVGNGYINLFTAPTILGYIAPSSSGRGRTLK